VNTFRAASSADELPQTRAEKPRYPEFVLQMHQNRERYRKRNGPNYGIRFHTGRERAGPGPLHGRAVCCHPPVKQTGTLVGHKTVQYFYQGDTRTALYLIDDGQRTYEIRGLVDSTDPAVSGAVLEHV
jgi:hypothetical protein